MVRYDLLLLGLAAAVKAEMLDVFWEMTYVTANPDGLHDRVVIGVNNSWPPPPIEATSGDLVRLHVLNSLDEATAVHAHGMFFPGHDWADGAAMVTQCGIPVGETFVYEIPVNSSNQFGTYWVHGHHRVQTVEGIKAPFIIHPPKEVHTYDDEYTILLTDWYHDRRAKLMKQFWSKSNPMGAEPVPNSSLMYVAKNGNYLGGYNQLANIPFQPGKTYRLRVINMSSYAAYHFRIDGHHMKIIEADATDVHPHPVDYLVIGAAQRYSVLVEALETKLGKYAVHAEQDTEMFDYEPEVFHPKSVSWITYGGSSAPAMPTSDSPDYQPFDDMVLQPIHPIALSAPTEIFELEVALETMSDGINRGMFNSITWNPPLVPTLFTALSMGNWTEDDRVYGPGVKVFQYGDVVDVVVINTDDNSHPFHLHGNTFAIVSRSEGEEEATSINPLRRDTIQIPGNSRATIRMEVRNPGVWMFHCHIEWHLESGLAMTFVFSPKKMQETFSLPDFVYSQCQKEGIPTRGNAAGHNSLTDMSGLKPLPHRQIMGFTAQAYAALAGCVTAAAVGIGAVGMYTFGENVS